MTVWVTAYLANKMHLTEKEVNEMPFYKVLLYSHALSVQEGACTAWQYADAATPKIELAEIDNILSGLE